MADKYYLIHKTRSSICQNKNAYSVPNISYTAEYLKRKQMQSPVTNKQHEQGLNNPCLHVTYADQKQPNSIMQLCRLTMYILQLNIATDCAKNPSIE